MSFDDTEANRKSAVAAATCFTRLSPDYQKNLANHQAICNKIDELNLDPREVASYETAWSEVTRDRAAEQTITYEAHGESFHGREAIERMPAYEYGRRLQEDPQFRQIAEALLGPTGGERR
jgi:hypothetical protein